MILARDEKVLGMPLDQIGFEYEPIFSSLMMNFTGPTKGVEL